MQKRINREAIRNSYLHAKEYLPDILEIATPIQDLGFAGFGYSKFKNHIRVVELITNKNYIDDYLVELSTYPDKDFFENYLPMLKPGLNIYPHDLFKLEKLNNNKILKNMIKNNVMNGTTFILTVMSSDSNEIENFQFDLSKNDSNFWSRKLAMLSELIEFTYHFKEKAWKIISSSVEKNKKFLITEPENHKLITDFNCKSISRFNTKKYYFNFLPDDQYLTLQEVRVLKAYCSGATVKESAKVLALSPRTVETHLKNIRHKVNTENLLKIIKSDPLANIFFN